MKTDRHLLAVLLLHIILSGCASLVKLPEATEDFEREPPLEAYTRVLHKYVNDRGEVDFPALQEDRADLDRYLAYIAHTPASAFTDPQERLAHYINSYNALSMYNVLDLGIPETHAGWRKVRFFFLREFIIGGNKMSLYAYENEWDLYTMYKLCGDWKTILIDFSPELIPACLSQNQRPQAQHNTGTFLFPSHS